MRATSCRPLRLRLVKLVLGLNLRHQIVLVLERRDLFAGELAPLHLDFAPHPIPVFDPALDAGRLIVMVVLLPLYRQFNISPFRRKIPSFLDNAGTARYARGQLCVLCR